MGKSKFIYLEYLSWVFRKYLDWVFRKYLFYLHAEGEDFCGSSEIRPSIVS